MRIISFAWTTSQLLAGKKTVTRRKWKKCNLKKGDMFQAWDKLPNHHGRKVAECKVVSIKKLPLRCITNEDEIKEGHNWGTARDFIQAWVDYYGGDEEQLVWRIEFEIVKYEE